MTTTGMEHARMISALLWPVRQSGAALEYYIVILYLGLHTTSPFNPIPQCISSLDLSTILICDDTQIARVLLKLLRNIFGKKLSSANNRQKIQWHVKNVALSFRYKK